MRVALAPALLALATLSAGCQGVEAGADDPAALRQGSLTLGNQRYPFTVTTCLRGALQTPDAFVLLGGGTAPDGQPFHVQADGHRGLVELRIKGAGAASAIYTAAFSPGGLRIQQNQILAEGPFRRVSGGGQVEGRFQAGCPQ